MPMAVLNNSHICRNIGATVHFNGTTTFIGNGGPGIEASLFSTLYFVGNTTFN